MGVVSKRRSRSAPCWPHLLKPAPMNTPQDMVEPFSHPAGVSGNTYSKKGRKSHKMRRREQKEQHREKTRLDKEKEILHRRAETP